jgi:hypothetical protein
LQGLQICGASAEVLPLKDPSGEVLVCEDCITFCKLRADDNRITFDHYQKKEKEAESHSGLSMLSQF